MTPSTTQTKQEKCCGVSLAAIFWLSGQTKAEGWPLVTDSAIALFETEYDLPLIPPVLRVQLVAYAWPTHLSWAALMLFLLAHGGGRWSLDRSLRLP